MSKTSVITSRLDTDTVAALDRLAAASDRSRAYLIAKAVNRFVEEERETRDFLQVGIDQANSGDVVLQEEIEAWYEARLASRTMSVAAE
jgi:predicted transcriptional regulator